MSFESDLVANGPAADIERELTLFGRFVGRWRVQNSLYSERAAEWRHSEALWTFAWILGGRGVQDVLVDDSGAAIGTTVRTWDDSAGWRVVWFCPRAGEHVVLSARETEAGIELDGVQADGRRVRWVFNAITRDSFAWDGWCSNDKGESWWHEQHMDAHRVG